MSTFSLPDVYSRYSRQLIETVDVFFFSIAAVAMIQKCAFYLWNGRIESASFCMLSRKNGRRASTIFRFPSSRLNGTIILGILQDDSTA